MESDFTIISKKFVDLLSLTIYDYKLWKQIRDYVNEKSGTSTLIDERYSDFFVPILIALQDRFILQLANLPNQVKNDNNKKVISIYELLEFVNNSKKKDSIKKKLLKLEKLKIKLNNWRNKVIAHKDYNLGLNGYKIFVKSNKISFEKIFKVMLLLGEIYNDIYRSVTKSKDGGTLFSINVGLGV